MTTDLTSSLIEGLYLMVVGMSFVLGFLTLVVLALRLLHYIAPKEVEVHQTVGTGRQVKDHRLMAAISAAVHQYQHDVESQGKQ